jgi:hypothetical protein
MLGLWILSPDGTPAPPAMNVITFPDRETCIFAARQYDASLPVNARSAWACVPADVTPLERDVS